MTDKNFEKINIKIMLSLQQSSPLRNFSHSIELQTVGQNLTQENMTDKKFEKINIKIRISIWQSNSVPNFSQFEELLILGLTLPK